MTESTTEDLESVTRTECRRIYDFIRKVFLPRALCDVVKPSTMGLVSSRSRIVMPATREMVDELIASDTIVIFSKSKCPYCKMAKQVFEALKKQYTAIELDSREDADDIQTILGEMTGARTVPRVFVKGECLGGGSDVKKLYDSGELLSKF